MTPGARLALALLLSLSSLRAAATPRPGPALPSPALAQNPAPADLEGRLLELTNGERQKLGLRPLRLSPELADVARRHSLDMAGHNFVAHVSSTGKNLQDRLVGADIYFSAAGENVAGGWPASAELINGSLMASPEHRKNILSPEFDTIGIGAGEDERGSFFVTEDFLEHLTVLDREQARKRAGLEVQKIRRGRSAPPLIWDNKADALAQDIAQAQAEGRDLPTIPPTFGEVHGLVVISSRFEDLGKQADEIGRAVYRGGGLGVAFSRTREDPGGAYFIALLLFRAPRRLGLSERVRTEPVMATIDGVRRARELWPLAGRDEKTRELPRCVFDVPAIQE